ncbi:MAG: PEP-CTERM sorting domain-containing protein [Planctomycetaceae bacterium]|nr:PEP-CTERM sorting domain-containing protein [Planctomycetaceae bacterium]
MMRKFDTSWIVAILIAIAVCAAASPSQAGFATYGLGMDVQSGTVANGALHVQCANNLWNAASGSGLLTNTYETSFSGYSCDDYAKAWLVTAVYGGSNLNTAKITATVNGHTIASPLVGNAGGVTDPNAGTYGSSVAGIWVLSVPVDPTYLHTDGSSDLVSVMVSDKTAGATQPFDGRSYYQALVTISQIASLNNTLDYAFAAGSGDIGTSSGYVTSRTLNLGNIGSLAVIQADLYAGYIYGDANQKDSLLLNGHSLLGDDVAHKNGTASYPADFVYASVPTADLLPTDNLLRFTVDPADFSGGIMESSLRPEFAILSVTHVVPEPGTISLAAAGVAALAFFLAASRRQAIR